MKKIKFWIWELIEKYPYICIVIKTLKNENEKV